MFEAAELGQKLSKKAFEALEPQLRLQLLETQQRLRQAGVPVIIVFAGVDGAGKGGTVNLLNAWMDPRWTQTHAYKERSQEEKERPPFWRYWRDLPPKGKIGFYLSAWYSRPVVDLVYGSTTEAEFDQTIARIATFEKLLADSGAVLLKFWMHLGKKQQKRRLKALQGDPLTSWRVTPTDWKHYEMYDRFVGVAERLIMKTSTGQAPWTIVDGQDPRYRLVSVAQHVQGAVEKRLEEVALEQEARRLAAKKSRGRKKAAPGQDSVESASLTPTTILQALDLSMRLEKRTYNSELKREQARLAELFREARRKGTSMILLFEGQDAAGKGGAIRRLTAALDARDYSVIPIAAPSDEERAHHYLWRFWRHLSRAGRVTIFDRSWYGRVLVERIEAFAAEKEWRRAYAEINHFEEQLVSHGTVLVKYWLQVDQDEQLRRFKDREQTAFKRWKLTEEDWRNRDKWDEYEMAVNEMIARTSTQMAPWTIVEANDKRFARVKVIRTVADALEQRLHGGKKGKKGRGKGNKDKK